MAHTFREAFLCVSLSFSFMLWVAASLSVIASEQETFTSLTNINHFGLQEPSDIVFHRQRGTLFVVGDEGHLAEVQTDGVLMQHKLIRPADFEGITYHPISGLLYVAVEGEERILEIDPDTFHILREFSIERSFHDRVLLLPGGGGIEALTFVPMTGHPHGGTFYLSNQNMSSEAQQDPSILFEVDLALPDTPNFDTSIPIQRYFSLGVSDISALYYDNTLDQLYVVSDQQNTLFAITRTGDVIASWELPGHDQEGFTRDAAGRVYIAQDTGEIITYQWHRKSMVKQKEGP